MLKRFFLFALLTAFMTNSAHADPDTVPSAPVTVTKPVQTPPKTLDPEPIPTAEGCPPASYTGKARPTSLAGLTLVAAAMLFVRRRRHTAQIN